MALITNTVLVPFSLAVYHSLRLSGYRRPIDQSWFEAGSVIYAAVCAPSPRAPLRPSDVASGGAG